MGNDYGGKRVCAVFGKQQFQKPVAVIIVQTSGGFIKNKCSLFIGWVLNESIYSLKAIAKSDSLFFSTAGPIGFGKDVDYLSD